MWLNNSLLFWAILSKLNKGKSMENVASNLEYDPRSDDWVDFQAKMEYIKEALFEGREDILTEHFTDKRSLPLKAGRRKTITNWLEGNSKKPKRFDVRRFKIGDLRLNDEPLFTDKSFRLWSLERFTQRLDSYLNHKEVQSHLQYIYFFDTHFSVQQVVSFSVSFPVANNNTLIQLQYENILYTGTIENFNNITYINVKNEFDYINFVFKVSANTSNHLKAFGVALSVDDSTGKPKAFMAMLTSFVLTPEEEAKYAHKMNFSNTMLAKDFSQECVIKEDYFMENFVQKLKRLKRDLSHYGINEEFSEDIYMDTILQEYKTYMKFLEKAHKHTKYFINSKKEAQVFSMKGICKDQKEEVSISYFLTIENLFLLDDKNPIIENQIKLIKEGKLSLRYVFVVVDSSLVSDKTIEKLEYMEANGIEVKLTSVSTSANSKLILIKGKNFALFKAKDVVDDSTKVTRHQKTINKLYLDQNLLFQDAMTLDAFMAKNNPLCGQWYFYAYGSAMEKHNCHEILLDIKNNHVKADFSSGLKEGIVHKTEKQVLLIFENSVIKISFYNMNETIFRVSTIGQDVYINQDDLLVFGLFSKEKLEKVDALALLESIHMKEEADYRLKVSDSFNRTLADFKASQKGER